MEKYLYNREVQKAFQVLGAAMIHADQGYWVTAFGIGKDSGKKTYIKMEMEVLTEEQANALAKDSSNKLDDELIVHPNTGKTEKGRKINKGWSL